MERETNISAWQMRLFESFDRDIMVMQRDEEEVFDGALHVFFEKEYYDAYVSRALRYGSHRYAYHEDKLGEAVYQIFDEVIPGLVFHIRASEEAPKNAPGDEKYMAARELFALRAAAEGYHFLHMAAIDRCSGAEAAARLWTKNVYIIGRLPGFGARPEESVKNAEGAKNAGGMMTMKRKKDGAKATQEDFDYESLKVFLTADSAMRFNPDKKPVNKYKLAMLSQLVRGKLHVIIEPHRDYWFEYDPAALDLTGYLDIPRYNEEMVRARVCAYTRMEKIYILLSPLHSDYRASLGSPFLVKADGKDVVMYLFEKYDDAAGYVVQNPGILPVFDGVFPIGVLDRGDRLLNLETMLALAAKLGVTGVNLDFDTVEAVGCRLDYIRQAAGYRAEAEELLSGGELSEVMREKDGERQYRMPSVPFSDQTNAYLVSEGRRIEIAAHIDNDFDQGLAFTAGCSVAEMIVMMQEAASRFETAAKAQDEEKKVCYARLMNRITVPLTEALCEKPYIYTLKDEDGSFILRNNIACLVVTNRYEAGRKGGGRLVPAGLDNPQFMEKLCETGRVAALTDGPDIACIVDTRLMGEAARQWRKAEFLREDLMICMTQGCDIPYPEAAYYYRRLKTDPDIFIEFTSAAANGGYPSIGMLTIGGCTAKDLADADGLNMVQAYDRLLSLKEKPGGAEQARSGPAGDGGEAKGFLGKLLKKTKKEE